MTETPDPQAPLPRRGADEQQRLDTELTAMFETHIPFNALLGLRVRSLDPARIVATFARRPELVGHYLYGRLHGGVISAALDALGGLAVMVAIGERHAHETAMAVMHRFSRIGTIDLRVDYLRPGLGDAFEASAEVVRLGGRVASVQARLHDPQQQLLATMTAAYTVS